MIQAPHEGKKQFPTRILKQWDRIIKIAEMEAIDEDIPIREYNRRTNTLFTYVSDGNIDNWLSPQEFIDTLRGDCEDFAIYKYFRLPFPRFLAVGMLPDGQAHAVLTLYAQEFGDWVVLDNLTDNIVTWDKYIKRFTPIYLCDEKAVYI